MHSPYWPNSIMLFLQICQLQIYSMMWVSHSTTLQRSSVWASDRGDQWIEGPSDQGMLFQCLIVQFWQACVNCSFSLLTGLAPSVVFCCCSPSASVLDMCVQRWDCADLCLKQLVVWVSIARLSSWSSFPNLLWALIITGPICQHKYCSLDLLSFLDHSL